MAVVEQKLERAYDEAFDKIRRVLSDNDPHSETAVEWGTDIADDGEYAVKTKAGTAVCYDDGRWEISSRRPSGTAQTILNTVFQAPLPIPEPANKRINDVQIQFTAAVQRIKESLSDDDLYRALVHEEEDVRLGLGPPTLGEFIAHEVVETEPGTAGWRARKVLRTDEDDFVPPERQQDVSAAAAAVAHGITTPNELDNWVQDKIWKGYYTVEQVGEDGVLVYGIHRDPFEFRIWAEDGDVRGSKAKHITDEQVARLTDSLSLYRASRLRQQALSPIVGSGMHYITLNGIPLVSAQALPTVESYLQAAYDVNVHAIDEQYSSLTYIGCQADRTSALPEGLQPVDMGRITQRLSIAGVDAENDTGRVCSICGAENEGLEETLYFGRGWDVDVPEQSDAEVRTIHRKCLPTLLDNLDAAWNESGALLSELL